MSDSEKTIERNLSASLHTSYQLLGKIARGGMGTVYVACRAGVHGFQRLYAVKLMHEHLADNREFVQMFLDEARIAARLHHPNVVAIVDVGEVDGRQFVVMDYVEGCSLSQLLKLSPDERPPAALVSIFSDFLAGLHVAHELSDDDGAPLHLVHRDVSPQNILIGLDGVARITDFGIAKAESRMTSTRPGLRKGKLAFMAPEQLHDAAIDRRADIFSAGAALWSALTGEALFTGSNDAATMRNLLQREVQPPSRVGLQPPEFLDEVCLKALDRDPAKRFQTAQEMAEAIRSASLTVGAPVSSSVVAAWMRDVAGDKIEVRKRSIGSLTSTDSSIRTVPLLVEESDEFSVPGIEPAQSMRPLEELRRRQRFSWPLAVILFVVFIAIVIAFLQPHDSQPPTENTGTVGRPALTSMVEDVTPSEPASPEPLPPSTMVKRDQSDEKPTRGTPRRTSSPSGRFKGTRRSMVSMKPQRTDRIAVPVENPRPPERAVALPPSADREPESPELPETDVPAPVKANDDGTKLEQNPYVRGM